MTVTLASKLLMEKRLSKVLSPQAIDLALPKVAAGLRKYVWLQNELVCRDVACDREYQRRFNGFYRVRRAEAWQAVYFGILKQGKAGGSSLPRTLRTLHAATGRIEASFASKLEATLDPHQPVIDSVVLRHLGATLPATGDAATRMARIVELRDRMTAAFKAYLRTDGGRYLVAQFAKEYPRVRVTHEKMLDLVLWRTPT